MTTIYKMPTSLVECSSGRLKLNDKDRKKGEWVYRNRPFIADIIAMMKTPAMKRLRRRDLKQNVDWRCFLIYMKLYQQLDSFYKEANATTRSIPDPTVSYIIHKIMTTSNYRRPVMKSLSESVSHHAEPHDMKKKKHRELICI